MEALIIIEGIVIALLVILVAGLLRSHAEILRQLDSLGAGEHHETFLAPPRRLTDQPESPIPALTGFTPRGENATVSLTGPHGHTLLAFLSSTCTSCGAFWNGSKQFGLEGVRPVVVTKGSEAESPSEIARLADPRHLTLMSTAAWDQFGVPATPYFALVDHTGRVVGEGSAADWARVEDMVRRAIAETGLRKGTKQRKADVDEELAAAGFEPGDPRLYKRPEQL